MSKSDSLKQWIEDKALRSVVSEVIKDGKVVEYYSGDYGDVCEDYPDCDNSCRGACQACLYCGSDQGDKCKCTVALVHYGYAIMDNNNQPLGWIEQGRYTIVQEDQIGKLKSTVEMYNSWKGGDQTTEYHFVLFNCWQRIFE